jgi:hypothetical protein
MGKDDQRTEKAEADKTWITQLLATAQSRRYYGVLAVVFEDGQIKRVKKEESLLPPM